MLKTYVRTETKLCDKCGEETVHEVILNDGNEESKCVQCYMTLDELEMIERHIDENSWRVL